VAGHHVGPECRSACVASPRFEVRAVVEVDANEAERGSEPGGDRLGELGVVVGRAAQTVVDVDGGDVAARCQCEGDQRSRISASGQTARDSGAVRRKGAPVEEVGGVEQRSASVSDP
jgi:hypothetical protein